MISHYWYDGQIEITAKEETVNDILRRDCASFLSQANGNLLYRGLRDLSTHQPETRVLTGTITVPLYKKKVRTDRRPLDTPEPQNTIISTWFKEKFGHNARKESVFAYPERSREDAAAYGKVFAYFQLVNFR